MCSLFIYSQLAVIFCLNVLLKSKNPNTEITIILQKKKKVWIIYIWEPVLLGNMLFYKQTKFLQKSFKKNSPIFKNKFLLPAWTY